MTEQIQQAKKDFSRIGLSLFTIAGVTTLLQLLLSALWAAFLQGTPVGDAEWMMWVLNFAPMYLVAVPVGLLLMKKVPADVQTGTKLGGKRFWILMLMCMPIMYGGNLIGNMLSAMLSGGTAENVLLDFVMGNPLYTILVAVILAPLLEEYIFRKQIIDRLGKYGEKTAIVFSALAFGLFHMNLFQFFYAFGLGLIFAYVYTRTRRLRYSVIMHMIINFMGSVIAPWLLTLLDLEALTAMETGEADMEQIMEMVPGLIAYMGYAGLLMLSSIAGLVLLIVNWQNRQLLPSANELPTGASVKTAYLNLGTILFTVLCLIMIVLSLVSGLL